MPDTTAPRSALPWYLTSASTWIAGMSLQGFLLTWMLVGMLDAPAERVGFGRALIELPALAVILIGGLVADRTDGRTLLARMHLLMALPGLALAWAAGADALTFWSVVAFGLAVSLLQALTDPARQAMLSRVTRTDIQRTVTLTTIVTSLVGLGAVWLGGRLDRMGLVPMLVLQASVFAAGALAARRLPGLPPIGRRAPIDVLGGLKSVAGSTLVRSVIGMNFVSSLFNAGAYIIALPFIVTKVYAGDASLFANVMITFTAGSIGSNVVLLRLMPLRHPGRWFLVLQLTRAVILTVLFLGPPLGWFYVAILAWGLNMGVTSTLARTTVQELAAPEARAQVLSVFLLSFMVAAPVSSVLLGYLIAGSTPLAALVPGILVSVALFTVGMPCSGLWGYASDAAPRTPPAPAHDNARGAPRADVATPGRRR